MVHSYFEAKYTQPDLDSSSSSDCENSDDRLDSIINSLLANLTIYKTENKEEMTIKKYKKDRNKHDRPTENDKPNDKSRAVNHLNYGAASSECSPMYSSTRRLPTDSHSFQEVRLSQASSAKRSRSLHPDTVNNPQSFDRSSYKKSDTLTENSGNNSEDEYYMATGSRSTQIPCQVEENQMSILLKEKKGWKIISVDADGACLFRAVAHQIFGKEEEHKLIREQVINYMKQNREHFSQFISEDFDRYLLRKLNPHTHGNHIEIQALSELYNRPVEIYFNSLEPINVFHREYTDLPPIRLSYHGGIHYNSIVDPQNPTVGEGLGMPNYQPRLSESELLEKAKLESENSQIEEAIFQTKMKQTEVFDLERSIAEQVANQSRLEYLQSLRQKKPETSQSISQPCNSLLEPSKPASSCPIAAFSRKRPSSPSTSSSASCSYSASAVAKPSSPAALNDGSLAAGGFHGYSLSSESEQAVASGASEVSDYVLRHVPSSMLDMDEDALLAMVMENSRQEYINSHFKDKTF